MIATIHNAAAEAMLPADGSGKLAIAANGATLYFLRCWRCRHLVEIDRRVFASHDVTTCATCQEQLRRSGTRESSVCPKRNSHESRYGFTLVELLIVIIIIGLLAGIVLLFLPKRESRLAADGASQMQAYLAGARSRAAREQRAVGVRLISADGGATFTGAILVSSPEPLAPIDPGDNSIYLDLPAGAAMTAVAQNTVHQVGVNLVNESVEVGDLLEIIEVEPSVHRIVSIDYTTNTLSLAGSLKLLDDGMGGKVPWVEGVPNVNRIAAARLLRNYRYIRAPRPLMGEQPWQLPKDIVIRGATGIIPSSHNIPLTQQGEWEIRFAPGGNVINAQGRVVLWIEDVGRLSAPTLLAIYPSGQVAAHPVGPAGQEYTYTQDGRSGQ